MDAKREGQLERRLRSTGGHCEIHTLWFPDTRRLDAFRADPRRRHLDHLMEASGARTELLAVEDVEQASPQAAVAVGALVTR